MKRGVKCASSLVIAVALFLMPLSSVNVYASETDKNFWAMWWLEQKTGVDWSKYTGMDAGLTYGEYVYRQTGRTVDYAVDTVCNGVSYDKTKQFVYNTVEDTRQTAKDMYNNMPGYPGVVQHFLDEKVWRVDGDGNVNVRGSDFWNSVYNDLFSDSGSTKDVYTQGNDGYSLPNYNINIQYIGFCDANYNNNFPFVPKETVSPYIDSGDYQTMEAVKKLEMNGENAGVLGFTVNGYYSEGPWGRFTSGSISRVYVDPEYPNYIVIEFTYTEYGNGSNSQTWIRLKVNVSNEDIQNSNTPVLQPSQVGFAIDPYTGIKYPIYTPYNPDSDNPAPPDNLPYTTNPDGTVTWTNPNPDPEHPENDTQDTDIYIDPDELTDDGWFLLLKWLTDNGYGTGTGGGYNGDGKNYNLDSLGDNATLIDIIKAGFKDLLNKINPFGDLINTIKNALSQLFSIDLSAFNSQEFEIDENFGIINAIWEKLLELMGVQLCLKHSI